MPRVNPEILIWARETAGLTQSMAAKKLGFHSSARSSAEEKLTAIENGVKEPSRPQLLKMADQYRRPLITFYLSKPPAVSGRGADFRTQHKERLPYSEGLLDALVRDIRARQSMVRAVLEDEEEAETLPFIGSHKIEDGQERVMESLRAQIRFDAERYRAERSASAAFDLLRRGAEGSGVFVLLKGDLGNHVSAIDSAIFRGFSIADNIAPFIVINDQDARPAWSFTLLHEAVHLLLGQTGLSGEYEDNDVERFCDDVAGNILLPANALSRLALEDAKDTLDTATRIGTFADEFKVSRSMVTYRAYRSQLIDRESYARLTGLFREQWRAQRQRNREMARDRDSHVDYYTVRRHRLGGRIVGLVGRMMAAEALSTSRAARILGVSPRQVQPLLGAGPLF